ncbi:hypothetical protein RMCBS344292_18608 [Rhizopus microsporus]|nr:hypothetical protein RMCBS344292_18608 [Rhizopus microsporus]
MFFFFTFPFFSYLFLLFYINKMLNYSKNTSSCSSTKSHDSIWRKVGKLFHPKCKSSSSSTSSSSTHSSTFSHRGNESSSTLSTMKSGEFDSQSSHTKRQRKQYVYQEEPSQLIIPPFSPTYLKANEFPYSNFYVKLPDGRWMVRYRDGNRDILRTDFVEGYLI